jgi:hypothetical protein
MRMERAAEMGRTAALQRSPVASEQEAIRSLSICATLRVVKATLDSLVSEMGWSLYKLALKWVAGEIGKYTQAQCRGGNDHTGEVS